MTEADFRTRQRTEAADTGTPIFADEVYDGWRDDALISISQLAPLDSSASLSVTPTDRTYGLPADCITLTTARLDALGYPVYRIEDANGGYLYLDQAFSVFGRVITLTTDPGVTATWTLKYGGTYTIATLPADWVKLALDHATASAARARASASATYFSYSMGSESVNRTAESKRWMEIAEERMAAFNAAAQLISTRASSLGSFPIFRS